MNIEQPLDNLVKALKSQQGYLKEALESIERQDMSPSEIKEFLKFVEKNMKYMTKDLKKQILPIH